MSKAVVSYYDWELSFKNKSNKDIKKESFNSLGITENDFKDFIKKWKKENIK